MHTSFEAGPMILKEIRKNLLGLELMKTGMSMLV